MELLETITQTVARASEFHCHRENASRMNVPGTPPEGYWDKAARLAGKYGYTLRYAIGGELEDPSDPDASAEGTTHGPMFDPPDEVLVKRGLSPAGEFQVIVHELAHMILGHSPEDFWENLMEMYNRAQNGTKENVMYETEAELASAAVSEAVGLADRENLHLCYLSGRLQAFEFAPDTTQRINSAALRAAQEITEAMTGKKAAA